MLLKPEETVLGKRPAGLDNRTAAPSVWDITAYSLHMTPLLTTAVVTIAALLLGRRARKRTRQLTFEDTASIGLPPLDPRESNAVMHDAEKAAIRVALGDKILQPIHHRRRTPANIIWETHFHSVLMDWDGDAV